MTRSRRRWIILGCVALVALAALLAVEWFRSNVIVPCSYSLVAEFGQMPADDRKLEQWLTEQSHMHPGSVMIERYKNQLMVSYTLLQNVKGQPELPDLDSKCQELGYVGTPFRDDIRGREEEARRRGLIE